MINKIKEILNILANNIEKYNVSIWRARYYKDGDTFFEIVFTKDNNKRYSFNFTSKVIYIRITNQNHSEIGGRNLCVDIPLNEVLPIKILLDTLELKGKEYIENSIKNLEL